MNRLEAAWDLVKTDRASNPSEGSIGRTAQDVAIKAYDIVSSAIPAAIGFISDNEFRVAPRDGVIAATRAAIGNTQKARWFAKGNPLNIAAKVTTGFFELGDGVVQDVLHAGRGKNGYVVQTAA